MNSRYLLFLVTIVCASNLKISFGQECNYITDYYQLVYEAQVDFLEENFEEAYRKLKEAESNCKLINQEGIDEFIKLAVLSEKFGKTEEAFDYLDRLLRMGFPFEKLSSRSYSESLKKYQEWNLLKDKSIEYQRLFNKKINYELRDEIINLYKRYNELMEARYPSSIAAVYDDYIEQGIKKILRTKGYPLPNLIGHENAGDYDLGLLLTRAKDTGYLKQVLLGYVKRGKAPPSSIALMIDAKRSQYDADSKQFLKGKSIYGIAHNDDSTDIWDFKNVDKRRVSIGLSSWKLRTRLKDLYRKLYPSFYE